MVRPSSVCKMIHNGRPDIPQRCTFEELDTLHALNVFVRDISHTLSSVHLFPDKPFSFTQMQESKRVWKLCINSLIVTKANWDNATDISNGPFSALPPQLVMY